MDCADYGTTTAIILRVTLQQLDDHARRQRQTLEEASDAVQANDSETSEAALQGTDLERGVGQAVA